MDATEAGKDSNGAIIRTGNANEKTVNITLTNCKLDAAGAVDRYGIVVMNKTNANISLENTKIKTNTAFSIKSLIGKPFCSYSSVYILLLPPEPVFFFSGSTYCLF